VDLLLLTPSILALVLALFLRNAFVALSAGALLGAILFLHQTPTAIPPYLLDIFLLKHLSSPWKMGALILTLQLGAFSALLDRNGSLQKLFDSIKASGRSKRASLISLAGAGVLCFYDGLANAILLGKLAKPIRSRFAVSPQKLAYIVDSTSSSVACLIIFSTWTAYQLSLISSAVVGTPLEGQALPLLIGSIPFNAYSIMSLVVLFVVLYKNINLGPMKQAEADAELAFSKRSNTTVDKQNIHNSELALRPTSAGLVVKLLFPISVLFFSFFVFVLIFSDADHSRGSFQFLINSLSSNNVPSYLNLSALLAWITLLLTKEQTLSFTEALRVSLTGLMDIAKPCLILFGAWALTSTISDLDVASFLASLFQASQFDMAWLPLYTFVAACILAFFTGTSWGTLALLIPLALPLAAELNAPIWSLQAIIGAIFGGAVFGDHCSPISDTTVVSAFATDCELKDHTKTQLPYALLAALLCILLVYIPIALAY